MHLSLDVWLTQSLSAAVSPGAQDSDPAPPVTSLGLRCGSGLAGHQVVLRVDLSEGLTGVATSQSRSRGECGSLLSPCWLLCFLLCFVIVYHHHCYFNVQVRGSRNLTALHSFVRLGKWGAFFP